MISARRLHRRTLAAAAAAAAGALVLTACGDDATSSGGNTQFVSGTGQLTTVKASERLAAPDISGETTDGGELALSDYRGKIVVLNVWGSWCAPCRAEAPNLRKVSEDTADRGVRFVGINTRDLDVANAEAFDRSFGIEYPSLYDPSGKLILKFPKNSLSPQAIPSTLILDRQGKIAVRALKPLSEKELREALEPVIEEK
ncbi:TlpA disulfide reductase family protein [Streptomyces sp. WMMC500]|uniref:TlpA family protein disulfide reductase n=1 Tax=Streptomyces sp. WMMC500 TaxID=3015154 RepID=UPI00248D1CB1|nr:TlpA disulfide reductase family protein [Streptomyces sp. WMMC500]WBB63924.1 TlpA disulfide reductase family protein [Streptomyces sp. WMMC500]